MDNALMTVDTGTSKKSFWERPEGKTGMIFLIAILAALGYAGMILLPTIIMLLQETVTALILCGVLAAILIVAMDARVHTLVSYGYRSIMRAITKVFIELDPINILKSYVQDLKAKRAQMDVQLAALKSELVKLDLQVKKNSKDITTEMNTAQAARNAGEERSPQFVIATKQAGRLQEFNKNLMATKVEVEKLYRFLGKLYETSGFYITDIQNEVAVKEAQYNSIQRAHKVWKTAVSILKGDDDKKMLFDQTMDFLVDDYGEKIGQIERFMESSSTYLRGAELQDMARQQEGIKMLDDWLNSSNLLQGTEKQLLITKAENPLERLDLTSPVGSSKENEYAKLL